MALGDYTPTAWVNGATPAINATNLGHIETKIDEIDAASAATSSTRIWSTSNDGNGGQPPSPKGTKTAVIIPISVGNMVLLPSIDGIFQVTAYVSNSGQNFMATMQVLTSENGTCRSANISNGANVFISVSGMYVQAYNNSGSPQNGYVEVYKMSSV